MNGGPWRSEVHAFLAATWLAGFVLFAPLVDGAINLFPVLLILTALAFGWQGMGETWRAQSLAFVGWYLFVGGALLSLANNQDWGFAGWRLERYWPFLFLPLVVNLLLRLRRPHWRFVGGSLVIGSLALAMVSAYHLLALNQARLGIPDSLNPNRVSEAAFVYAVMLLAALAALPGLGRWRVPLVVGLAGAFYAGLAAGSRTAFAAFALAGAGLALAWVLRERRWWAAGVVLVVALSAGAIVTQVSDFSERLWDARDHLAAYREDPSEVSPLSIRLNLWHAALRIAAEHPLVGTGLGDAQHDAQRLVEAGEIPLHKSYARFHSTYAGALATSGLIGLGTLLAGLFILPAAHLARQARETRQGPLAVYGAWAGLAVLAFYLPLGLASSWLFNRGMPVFYVAMAVAFALSRFRQQAGGRQPGGSRSTSA